MRHATKWALAGLLLCASCSCSDGERPRDGGPSDASIGADGSSPPDGGLDARVADADAAAPDPDDPGWVLLPGLPDWCVVERATRPEAVFEMKWRPCAGIDGCEELDGSAAFSLSGTFEDGVGYLQPVISASFGDAQVDVLTSADGPVMGAWRYPRYRGDGLCMVNPMAAGGGRAAFGVYQLREGQSEEHRLYVGDLANIRDVDTPLATLDRRALGGGGAFQGLGVSSDMVVVLNGFGLIVTDEGTRVLPPLPGFSRSGFASPVSVVGAHAFFTDWAGDGRAVHVSRDGDPEVMVEVAGGDVRSFVTDGVDMAWRQTRLAPEGGFESCELWTAPLATDPSSLSPRKVGDVPDGECTSGVIGAGYVAYGRKVGDDPYRAEVVLIRLADGMRSVVRFPAGHGAEPIYVSPNAVVSRRTRGDELGVYRSSLDSAVPE